MPIWLPRRRQGSRLGLQKSSFITVDLTECGVVEVIEDSGSSRGARPHSHGPRHRAAFPASSTTDAATVRLTASMKPRSSVSSVSLGRW